MFKFKLFGDALATLRRIALSMPANFLSGALLAHN
jgi:hypothetical protein